MITLHLLQYLLNNGFGTGIESDLFYEELPLGKNGIAIYSRGGDMNEGRSRFKKRFDLYSRGNSNLSGALALENIKEFFANNSDDLCALPIVPDVSNRIYYNCKMLAVGDIENIGLDENDRVIFRMGCEIIYKK